MNENGTTDKFAKFEEESTLVMQRWLPDPVERIWRYLTESELRCKWLASGEMKLAPGASFELIWRNDNLSHSSDARPSAFPEEQRMMSHIIAVDPMRLLTFAWGDGTVTFELQPKGEKVFLSLTHRGLNDPAARSMIAAGWHMHLDIMSASISGQEAASFWSGWAKLQETYEERI